MMKYILIVLALFLSWTTEAQDKSVPEGVLFTINQVPVRADEFTYLFRKNHTKKEDFTEAKIEEYFNLMIHFKLKVSEARSRGMDTTQAFQKELKSYKDELKKPYIADGDELDRLTREAYGRLTVEVKAAHILISIKSDALPSDTIIAYQKIVDIRKRVISGESFEALAQNFSEDPSAKSNAGLLGYFTALQMVYPFEQEAYRTTPGQISNIVRTRFGYHLIKVYDRRPALGEVEISHILLRTNNESDSKQRDKALAIFDQLRAGRPWDELCKEFSEDGNTKNSGGRLRAFGTGAFSRIPEFERVAFSLKNPGEYSDPFQSSYGWHIIRLEKKIPVPTFTEIEPSLRKRVAKDDRNADAKSLLLERKKAKYSLTEIRSSRAALIQLSDSALLRGAWSYHGIDSLLRSILFHIENQPVTVKEFVHFALSHQSRTGLSPEGAMNQLIGRFEEFKIAQREEQNLMRDNPGYRMLANEYEEGILLFEIMEKEVWNKASADSVGQEKYYKKHLGLFKVGNRIEARIFSTSDKLFADGLIKKIVSGDSLTKLESKQLKAVSSWRNYDHHESQVVDQINWVPGIQTVEQKGTFFIVEVRRLVPPGIKSFDEARAAIITGYQDELEREWIARLKQKFPVRINKKIKLAVIASLKK